MNAETQVKTEIAPKYLKWLCGHFNLKAQAEYDETHGTVQFEFGTCEMQAKGDALWIQVSAEDEESLKRIKYVVGDHLEHFGRKESIQVSWIDK